MSVLLFQRKKARKQPICMLTCYDYTSATIIANTNVDAILVGDSVAMVMHGYPNTTYATLEMMVLHTQAVRRGSPDQFIVADMPFMSDRLSVKDTLLAGRALIQAGAQAVKCEGAVGNLAMIRALVEGGIPVMGHLGLTCQHIHQLGGFRVQGKSRSTWPVIEEQAQALTNAGCFSMVLECIPSELATRITQQTPVATIGIGAGARTDGQILVLQDLVGLNQQHVPRFARAFSSAADVIKQGVVDYVEAVQSGAFPTVEHTYEIKEVVDAGHS